MRRVFKFIVFNVFFSLLPIIIVGSISFLVTADNTFEYNYIPELLFYTLMICSSILYELFEINSIHRRDIPLNIFIIVLILLCIISSLFYGCSIVENYININVFDMRKLRVFSIGVAIMSTILSIGITYFISKIEG